MSVQVISKILIPQILKLGYFKFQLLNTPFDKHDSNLLLHRLIWAFWFRIRHFVELLCAKLVSNDQVYELIIWRGSSFISYTSAMLVLANTNRCYLFFRRIKRLSSVIIEIYLTVSWIWLKIIVYLFFNKQLSQTHEIILTLVERV